jgi:hypothetical protein
MEKVNYATPEKEGKAGLYVLLKRRKGITLATYNSYWKNVHGPVAARLPDLYQYSQFHLEQIEDILWSVTDGIEIESDTLEEDQLDGIAELTFLTEEERQTWINAAEILASDEQNFVSKAVIYLTNNGNSKTYVDGIETRDPNGDLDVVKFHVMVKKANAITVDDFRQYMAGKFAPALLKSDLVIKFRLHLLEEHDNSIPSSPGVSYYEPLEKQYQAAFEIAFKNRLDMEKFFASKAYAAAVKAQTKYIKQLTAFPEQNTYTLVYDGKMTLAGQRTPTVAELIVNLGATNQTEGQILNLMLGKVGL